MVCKKKLFPFIILHIYFLSIFFFKYGSSYLSKHMQLHFLSALRTGKKKQRWETSHQDILALKTNVS
jgi:hypothetical protein